MDPLRSLFNNFRKPQLDTGDGVLTPEQIRNRKILAEGSLTRDKTHAEGVKTYWASETDEMDRDRKAFVESQVNVCCAHGRGYTTNWSSTMEFVPEYRLCACCGVRRKKREFTAEGADPRLCAICAREDMAIEGLADDPEVQRELLLADGWEPVTAAKALELEADLKAACGEGAQPRWMNSSEALHVARETGEDVWRHTGKEQEDIAEEFAEKAKEMKRYAGPDPIVGPFSQPKGMWEQMRERAQEPIEPLEHLHLGTLGHALSQNAWKRFRALGS